MTAQDTLLKQVNTRRDTRLAEKQASCVPSHTQKPPRPTRGTGVGFMTTGNVRCSILGVLRDRGRSPGSLLFSVVCAALGNLDAPVPYAVDQPVGVINTAAPPAGEVAL